MTPMRRPQRSRSASTSAARPGPPTRSNTNSARSRDPAQADVAADHPEAAAQARLRRHLSRPSSPGAQPVCVYAINVGPGADRLLGCKTLGIPVAITLSHVRATPSGVRLRIACEWPAGTECPGQLALRSPIKVALPHRRGTPPRIRVVTRSLGRRTFHLTGERSHAFAVSLTESGRALLRSRGSAADAADRGDPRRAPSRGAEPAPPRRLDRAASPRAGSPPAPRASRAAPA